jgi:hypothetical protein
MLRFHRPTHGRTRILNTRGIRLKVGTGNQGTERRGKTQDVWLGTGPLESFPSAGSVDSWQQTDANTRRSGHRKGFHPAAGHPPNSHVRTRHHNMHNIRTYVINTHALPQLHTTHSLYTHTRPTRHSHCLTHTHGTPAVPQHQQRNGEGTSALETRNPQQKKTNNQKRYKSFLT